MNFKINKKELLDALNISSKAVSTTVPLPAFSGIKFIIKKADEEFKSDHLSLISSDSNISIFNTILKEENENIIIEEEGEIVLDAKYIVEIVRKIDGDIISFETLDSNYIKIYGTNSEFKINGISADTYPNIAFDFNENANKIRMNASELFDAVSQTIFACSTSDVKPALTGVNFKAQNGILTVNATDSYRLAMKKISLAEEYKNMEFNITIPSKYLNDIYHSIPATKDIDVIIDNQKIGFNFNNIIIQTRLLDDIFPDTSKLIANSYNQKLLINSKDLLSAIDRTSFIKSEGKNIIKMDINNEAILLTSNDQISSSYEKIPLISYEGEAFEISCSGKYLTDAIKALDCEKTCLSFSGSLKPFIATNVEDESIIQLISPVRTYK